MTKPPTCWLRWRGKPMISPIRRDGLRQPAVGRVQPQLADARRARRRRRTSPRSAPQRGGHILRRGPSPCPPRGSRRGSGNGSPWRRARRGGGHIARRCAGSPPRGAHARNPRRYRAARRDVSEMKRSNTMVMTSGPTSVMPSSIADDRIGRRAAPLAEDAAAPGQIARCHARSGNRRQSPAPRPAPAPFRPGPGTSVRHAAGIAPVQPRAGQPFQPLLAGSRRPAPRRDIHSDSSLRSKAAARRRSPACGAARPGGGETAAPCRRPPSGGARHWAGRGCRSGRW